MRSPAVPACGAAVLIACAPAAHRGTSPRPALPPRVEFQVIGNAAPSDSGPPSLRLDSQTVTIRGMALQVEGGGVYGDVDLTQPHTLRLTLYDSLPGRPVDDPPPRSAGYRQVVYEVRIGPLAPGPYEVWVGRFDPRGPLVEVAHEPLRIEVERAAAPTEAKPRP